MIGIYAEIAVLVTTFALFICLKFYTKWVNFQESPIKSSIPYLTLGALLSYLIGAYSIFLFQIVLISARIIFANTNNIKNNILRSLSFFGERAVLVIVLLFILMSNLPMKAVVIIALLGERILTYSFSIFRHKLSSKSPTTFGNYLIYTHLVIFILASSLRHSF